MSRHSPIRWNHELDPVEDDRKRRRQDSRGEEDYKRRRADDERDYRRRSDREDDRRGLTYRRDRSPRRGSPVREDTRRRNDERLDAQVHAQEDRARKDDLAPLPAPTGQAAVKAPAVPKAPGKAGGVYVPPFKLAQLMAAEAAKDRAGAQFQRLTWDALRKSINALVNKVTKGNIKSIVQEIFQENLIRGRGLLCRSLMRSQIASPSFTPIFAALVAIINTKLREVGALLVTRLIMQFKRSLRRRDRAICVPATIFLAHLINQQVADHYLAFEVLYTLISEPSDDSIEIAINFLKECGAHLEDVERTLMFTAIEDMRKVMANAELEQRTTFLLEELMRVRRVGFEKSGFPSVAPELDLVEHDDKREHLIKLDSEDLKAETELDIFREDPDFEKNEQDWQRIKKDILGENEEEEDDDEESASGESDSDDSDQDAAPMEIQDQTETNVINLRRTIYLTIMSALDFEEAGHKLLKIELRDGQESEIVLMIIECCSQEKTYLNYYGLLAQRFSMLHQKWQALFEDCFTKQYALIHRLETNKLRNVAKLFAHLLYTDAISWAVLSGILLTEDDTTSSARIFIKILFQEMAENMGLAKLNERLQDPMAAQWVAGLFPRDTPRNMRFSINFFTSIGLGGLTDAMRAHLKELPKRILAEQQAAAAAAANEPSSSSDDSSSDSSSSDDSSSNSSSDSSSSDSSTDSSDSSSSDDSSSSEEDRKKRSSKRKGKSSGKSVAKQNRASKKSMPEDLPLPPPPARPAVPSQVVAKPPRVAENGRSREYDAERRDRAERDGDRDRVRSRRDYDHDREPRRRSVTPPRRSHRSVSPRRSRRDRD